MELAAQIVSAHLSNHTVEVGALPGLIQDICRALTEAKGGIRRPDAMEKLISAALIKNSVYRDYNIRLEDRTKRLRSG
jgi:predicted transcriptional regulator